MNDKIYVVGGNAGLGPISMVEVYDPATDTWTEQTDVPTPRYTVATSVVDGIIYVIGGKGGPAKVDNWASRANMVDAYDPVTDTWTRKADMPSPRWLHSSCVVNGKIYVIGGWDDTRFLSTVEQYDPATDIWTVKAPMPTARCLLGISVVNGKICAIGGWNGSNMISTVEVYDPVTDTWTKRIDIPIPTEGLSTSVVDGIIYVMGGYALGDTLTSGADTSAVYASDSIVDFNGDGLVDIKDLLRLIESWGQDDPMVDIAPPPFGDGVVDVLDLELLMSFWEQPVDDPTLLAHWALDEAEGAVAYDSSGVNDASVVGGAAWQPNGGQVDGALQLDGIDGCAVSGPVLNPADGPFSVFAWINGGLPEQVVVSQQGATDWLMANTEGNLMTDLKGSGRSGGPLQSQTIIVDGHWHRIGFVWDGLNRALYVDDILAAMDTQQGLASSIGGLNIGCGMNSAAGTFWFDMIDEVRIYSRALSP